MGPVPGGCPGSHRPLLSAPPRNGVRSDHGLAASWRGRAGGLVFPAVKHELELVGRIRKGQNVRLFDVFLLGPWLVYLGLRPGPGLSDIERGALVAIGAGTVVFNGANYLRIQAELCAINANLKAE